MKNFILVILHPFCSLQFLPRLVVIADSEIEQLGSQSGSFGVVCVCLCVCISHGHNYPLGSPFLMFIFLGKATKILPSPLPFVDR